MSNAKPAASQSRTSSNWTGTQAYALAVCCLLLGVALGYLFRGSAAPNPQTAAVSMTNSEQGQGATRPQPSDAEKQAMLTQAAAPLLDAVNKDPNDYDSLVKLGNLFYDGQQYPTAIQYYERALTLHPENPDVRTDMGTAYFYNGNSDRAIAELQKSLKYRPGHPQTLFNIGWILWQGKQDPKGASAAWQELLKTNPDYPQRQQVEQYIAKAKEHASRG